MAVKTNSWHVDTSKFMMDPVSGFGKTTGWEIIGVESFSI
jgi:hypothetical protein